MNGETLSEEKLEEITSPLVTAEDISSSSENRDNEITVFSLLKVGVDFAMIRPSLTLLILW